MCAHTIFSLEKICSYMFDRFSYSSLKMVGFLHSLFSHCKQKKKNYYFSIYITNTQKSIYSTGYKGWNCVFFSFSFKRKNKVKKKGHNCFKSLDIPWNIYIVRYIYLFRGSFFVLCFSYKVMKSEKLTLNPLNFLM